MSLQTSLRRLTPKDPIRLLPVLGYSTPSAVLRPLPGKGVVHPKPPLEVRDAFAGRDTAAFAREVERLQMDQFAPDAVLHVIDMAISLEMVSCARGLVTRAVKQFPQHARLAQTARVLEPPRARVVPSVKPSTGLGDSQAWLQRNASEHEGRWVALEGDILRGEAATLRALHEMLTPLELDPADLLITKILPQ